MSETSVNFVNFVFEKKKNDSAFRATMKNATNEKLEWKAWPHIEKFIGNINDSDRRHIFALVGESIAKSKNESNGELSFGKAMYVVQDKDANDKKPDYSPRMVRVLSFDSLDDLLGVFKQLLPFLDSRDISLNYALILDDLLLARFEKNYESLKAKWASDYFKKEE